MQEAVESVKSQASEVAENVKSDVQARANTAKQSVADEVADVADALRAAADKTRHGSPQERTIGQIAESLADASDAIRGKDFSEMVGGINNFARNNPTVFLGAAALIGFAASRFGKASTSASPAGSGEHSADDRMPVQRRHGGASTTPAQARTTDPHDGVAAARRTPPAM